jgi:hypothetical protein
MARRRIFIVPESVARKVDDNRGDVSRADFIDSCIDSCLKEEPGRDRYATTEEFQECKQEIEVEEPKSKDVSVALWVAAIVLFGFADSLVSYLVFAAGGREANPFMVLVASAGGIWGFVIIKTVILIGLIFLSALCFGKQQWIVPTILSLLGVFLLVHNLVTLFHII